MGDQVAAVALAECARRFGLTVGEPYSQGAAGYAVRAQSDPHRARGWTIGQTIAWAIDGPEEHLDVVRWLLER